MYIYIYVCVCVCVYIYKDIHTYIYLSINLSIQIYLFLSLSLSFSLSLYIYIYIHIYIYCTWPCPTGIRRLGSQPDNGRRPSVASAPQREANIGEASPKHLLWPEKKKKMSTLEQCSMLTWFYKDSKCKNSSTPQGL